MANSDDQNQQGEPTNQPRKRKKGRRGHGEGSVFYRKGRKQWMIQITLEDGSQKQYYGFKTQEEAITRKNELLQELRQGTLVTEPLQKLGAYLMQWLEEVHKDSIRLTTYRRYRIVIEKHIIPALGHIPVQKLTPQQVQSFLAKKVRDGEAPTTIKLMHAVLRVALKHAVRWKLVSRNVCDLVSLPQAAPREAKTLTLEQARTLFETAKAHQLEALLVLALITGMREGELLALKWQDIDLERRALQVRRTVVFLSRVGYREHKPKTEKGLRTIILPQVAVNTLLAHRERQIEVKRKAGLRWRDLDLVFCNAYGYYRSSSNLRAQFRKLLKGAGLPEMRFHDLRHSAATILLSMGVHPKVVQEILGHSSIEVTMNVYSHVIPPVQRDAMDKWDTNL